MGLYFNVNKSSIILFFSKCLPWPISLTNHRHRALSLTNQRSFLWAELSLKHVNICDSEQMRKKEGTVTAALTSFTFLLSKQRNVQGNHGQSYFRKGVFCLFSYPDTFMLVLILVRGQTPPCTNYVFQEGESGTRFELLCNYFLLVVFCITLPHGKISSNKVHKKSYQIKFIFYNLMCPIREFVQII